MNRTYAPRDASYTNPLARRRPAATAPAAPRANQYPGTCADCGQHVPAQAGRVEKIGGRWTPRHLDGYCPEPDEATDTAPAVPAYRANRFAGPCVKCGAWVDEGAGRVDKSGQGWRTAHVGDCPVAAPVGIYRTPDGEIWRVRPGRGQKDVPAGRQRRYAARLVESNVARYTEAGAKVKFDWERDESGMLYRLAAEMLVPLDDEDVKALMIATGQCIACDAALYAERTMKRVRETGIMVGPVCRLSFAPANAPAAGPEYTRSERRRPV
jgi:hypothetical protein